MQIHWISTINSTFQIHMLNKMSVNHSAQCGYAVDAAELDQISVHVCVDVNTSVALQINWKQMGSYTGIQLAN